MWNLSVLKIRFPERGKHKKSKSLAAPEQAIPMKQVVKIIDLSKNCVQKSSKNEPLKKETSEKLSPGVKSPEELSYD